jgi:hypothetical protein
VARAEIFGATVGVLVPLVGDEFVALAACVGDDVTGAAVRLGKGVVVAPAIGGTNTVGVGMGVARSYAASAEGPAVGGLLGLPFGSTPSELMSTVPAFCGNSSNTTAPAASLGRTRTTTCPFAAF